VSERGGGEKKGGRKRLPGCLLRNIRCPGREKEKTSDVVNEKKKKLPVPEGTSSRFCGKKKKWGFLVSYGTEREREDP